MVLDYDKVSELQNRETVRLEQNKQKQHELARKEQIFHTKRMTC